MVIFSSSFTTVFSETFFFASARASRLASFASAFSLCLLSSSSVGFFFTQNCLPFIMLTSVISSSSEEDSSESESHAGSSFPESEPESESESEESESEPEESDDDNLQAAIDASLHA